MRRACCRRRATATLLVGRDQRVLSLPLRCRVARRRATRAPSQLKPAEKADAAARRLREAWIGG